MTYDTIFISDLRFSKDALRVYLEEKKGTFYDSKLFILPSIIIISRSELGWSPENNEHNWRPEQVSEYEKEE
jgi:hypothetical protein